MARKKQAVKAFTPRGTGKANLIVFMDYANGESTSFRAETDVPRTPENAVEFDKFVRRLKAGIADKSKLTDFLTGEISTMGGSATERKTAKNMILAAFGQPTIPVSDGAKKKTGG